ncbi:hypothetical protein GCM10027446_01550 [Angustibacter peucedani]
MCSPKVSGGQVLPRPQKWAVLQEEPRANQKHYNRDDHEEARTAKGQHAGRLAQVRDLHLRHGRSATRPALAPIVCSCRTPAERPVMPR